MNYILNIHTTAEKAIVNICNENDVIKHFINAEQKEHASFLHIAIKKILQDNDIAISALKAIGVTGWPRFLYRHKSWIGYSKRIMFCFTNSYDDV